MVRLLSFFRWSNCSDSMGSKPHPIAVLRGGSLQHFLELQFTGMCSNSPTSCSHLPFLSISVSQCHVLMIVVGWIPSWSGRKKVNPRPDLGYQVHIFPSLQIIPSRWCNVIEKWHETSWNPSVASIRKICQGPCLHHHLKYLQKLSETGLKPIPSGKHTNTPVENGPVESAWVVPWIAWWIFPTLWTFTLR